MDPAREKRELNRGFGVTLNRGFEFVLTMVLFGVVGYVIDRAAGTTPVFLVVFALVGAVGQTARLWYAYDAAMRRYEADLPSRAAPPNTGEGER